MSVDMRAAPIRRTREVTKDSPPMIRIGSPLRRLRLPVLILLVAGAASALVHQRPRSIAPAESAPEMLPVSYRQDADADKDPFKGGVAWINTAAPIKLSDLKGKIVLLDFWTFCCINCHHVLPDLAKLEKKYGDSLVVIGVHTAKFDAERETENIRKKVNEYGIKHPVVNDANQEIWNTFGVSSWPTLFLVDPTGKPIGYVAGEGHYDLLDQKIGELVHEHRRKKTLDETPLHFQAESDKPRTTALAYPGKVTADAAGNRLFISDTANNRIVVTDLEGKHLDTIGTGLVGKDDGAYDKASFHRPQGTRLIGSTLYVADTENHMIRAVDLTKKVVMTVAGNGEQSHMRRGHGPAKTTGLNSPWDIILVPNTRTLLIAMAGPHQIWKLDLDSGDVAVWAGSGREDIQDGEIHAAAFAQPSGLATDGKNLFVADSEGSAVRAINLTMPHQVRTLVGTHDLDMGQSLFAFGDKDGKGDAARLQHCLGLAYADGKLYVADTYNNKIKVVDPATSKIDTLSGSTESGATDAPPLFAEPGGLSVAGKTLYVADTNNSAIRAIDLETKAVRTLKLEGVEGPKPTKRKPTFFRPTTIDHATVDVKPGDGFTLDVELRVPAGFKVSPDAPMVYVVEAPGKPEALSSEADPNGQRVEPPSASFKVRVPLAKPAVAGDALTVRLSLQAFLCKSNSLCSIHNYVWSIPVKFSDNGRTEVRITNPAK